MLQSVKYKIIIYALLGAVLLVLLIFGAYFFTAQSRDYQRLADLKVWQNILSDYYIKNGTYAVPGCDSGRLLSRCLTAKAGNETIINISDPINAGPYQYTVADLSDSDYEINFSLEAGIGGLKPGQYIWTKNGVKR